MVWRKANRPQQYIKILKEVTMEAKESKIPRVIKLAIQKVKTKPKILAEKNI